MHRHTFIRAAACWTAAAWAAASGSAAFCQPAAPEWPTRPIRVVLPYAPGGNTDVVTREIMKELSQRLGQPITIDNRPGANGIIGADAVAKSPADGYTLLVGLGALTINPALQKSLPYSLDDLAPISLTGRTHLILVTSNDLPIHSLSDLVAYSKAGHQVTYSSSGIGSAVHLASARLALATGMSATHVPYKGTGTAIADILTGRITFVVDAMTPMGNYVREGKMKALAVFSKVREPLLPDVPTVVELGWPQLEIYPWSGLFAPANTPRPIIDKLSTELSAILKTPAVRDKLATMGSEAVGTTPGEFKSFLKDDLATSADTVRRARITLD